VRTKRRPASTGSSLTRGTRSMALGAPHHILMLLLMLLLLVSHAGAAASTRSSTSRTRGTLKQGAAASRPARPASCSGLLS